MQLTNETKLNQSNNTKYLEMNVQWMQSLKI